ncbi:hypothetical protein C8R45DRAFT_1163537 [Mycena sanguinolenta]|nr:hypothetical protein C8R45DRAFT_1163537 [Mycena sanguinolenta]
MSFQLPPRESCRTCTNQCGGFYCKLPDGSYRAYPDTPQMLCFCGHPYFAHHSTISAAGAVVPNISNPNPQPAEESSRNPVVAPPSSLLPPSNSNPFSTHAHSSLPQSILPRSTVPSLPPQPLQPAQTHTLPPQHNQNPFAPSPSLPPPRAAFNNVMANSRTSSQIATWTMPDLVHNNGDSSSSVQHQRQRSIQRMHTTNGTSPRGGRARRSGLADSQPSSSSADVVDGNLPAGVSRPKAGQVAWFLGLLPFTLGNHVHPEEGRIKCYSFQTMENTAPLVNALTAHNLTTCLVLDKTGAQVWSRFDAHIRSHLAENSIIFPPHPQHPTSRQFIHASWRLLEMKSAIIGHRRKLTPSRLEMEPPVHGHASGPFEDFLFNPVPHACLPWRVFWELQDVSHFDRENGGEAPRCLQECPHVAVAGESWRKRNTSSPAPHEVPENKRPRIAVEDSPLPPVSELLDNIRPLVKLPDSIIEIDDDELSDPESAGTQGQQEALRQLLDADSETVTTQSASDIAAWRGLICGDIDENSLQGLYISGPTTLSIAKTLITAINTLHSGQEFNGNWHAEPGTSLDYPLTAICAILHTDRLVRVSNPQTDAATGPGPENSVFVRGLGLRLSDQARWVKSSGIYFRPQFYGLPIHRDEVIASFKVDGTWAALYMIQIGLGPEPLCPFLLLAAAQRDNTWLRGLTLAYINALDPAAAKTLAPWFAIKAEDVFDLSRQASHPGIVLALNYVPGIARPQEVHDFIHVAILTGYFFGVPDPWAHAEFRAFATGFAIELGAGRTLLDHCADFLAFQARLVSMYNQRISSVQDVIEKLQFTFKDAAELTEKELLQVQMFQLRFLRWIRGIGYPRSISGKYITEKEYKAHRKDPLIRAQRFLFSMTERYAMPLDQDFILTVCLYRIPGAGKHHLHFRDCVNTVEIPLNEWTDNLLLEDVDFNDTSIVTDFDHWFSAECTLDGGDYNAL